MNPITEDYLAHHGVKGQRWGVRRYQNEDGTLTDKGKKRANRKAAHDAKVKDYYDSMNAYSDYVSLNKEDRKKVASKLSNSEKDKIKRGGMHSRSLAAAGAMGISAGISSGAGPIGMATAAATSGAATIALNKIRDSYRLKDLKKKSNKGKEYLNRYNK